MATEITEARRLWNAIGAKTEKNSIKPADVNTAAQTTLNAVEETTPAIGSNGNWYVGTVDTGIKAQGPKGDTGTTGPKGEQGLQGTPGTNGTDGAPGANGTDGLSILQGSVAPTSAIGKVGDLYLNTATYDISKKTGTSTWAYLCNIKGATGTQGLPGTPGANGTNGADGLSILQGSVAPTSAIGKVGDLYLNTATYDISKKTTATSWTVLCNIKGPQGLSGTNGTNGTNGTDGLSILQGTVAPTSAIGKVGDLYLNTATYDISKKTTATSWTVLCNIKGPQGLSGTPGTNGTNGAPGAPGTDGLSILQDTVAPTSAIGKVGDLYLNTATYDISKKTTATNWTVLCNIKGPQGLSGTPGTNGTNGTDGLSILQGTVAPTSAIGKVGDLYLNTLNFNLYKKISATVWQLLGNIKGETGPQGLPGTNGTNGADGTPGTNGTNGTDGLSILQGTSNPESLGKVGDLYINTTTYGLWKKITINTWQLIGNIKGADGAPGADGTPGADGADGLSILQGTSTPTSSIGKIGDLYLNTANFNLYKKTNTTTWQLLGNIKGATGPQGANGANGADLSIVEENIIITASSCAVVFSSNYPTLQEIRLTGNNGYHDLRLSRTNRFKNYILIRNDSGNNTILTLNKLNEYLITESNKFNILKDNYLLLEVVGTTKYTIVHDKQNLFQI